MNKGEIENYCRAFLKDHYNINLAIPVVLNPLLSKTLGSFIYNRVTNKPMELEFSKKFMMYGNVEDKHKVIKHECIHYALFIQGKPSKDGDSYFESELLKHNSTSTETISFKIERNVRVYKCSCKEYVFRQTISPKICIECNQNLVYRGQRRQLI